MRALSATLLALIASLGVVLAWGLPQAPQPLQAPPTRTVCECPGKGADACRCAGSAAGDCGCGKQRKRTQCGAVCVCGCNDVGHDCRCGEPAKASRSPCGKLLCQCGCRDGEGCRCAVKKSCPKCD